MADQTVDPYRAYNFVVQVSGIDDSRFYFSKCSALGVTVDNQEYREAGHEMVTRPAPTRIEYDPITLSYGVTDSRALWDWLMKTAGGQVERKNVSIAIRADDGSTIKEHWELINAWPQKWQGAELDASGNGIAIAQLTLVYDHVQRKSE